MSKLSRAIKYIFLIWILSITFAVPQAIQTGVVDAGNGKTWCTVVNERVLIEHSFELATVLFFFAPMSLITILYILIGMKLRSSTMITRENGSVHRNNNLTSSNHQNTSQSTKRVLKMLGKWLKILYRLPLTYFHSEHELTTKTFLSATFLRVFCFENESSSIQFTTAIKLGIWMFDNATKKRLIN